MADEFELDTDDLQRRMERAIGSLRTEFASLRTGRASGSMLEPVQVEAYGQMTPINQLGTINVPEPRMVTINVWDRSMVSKVEKAIRDSVSVSTRRPTAPSSCCLSPSSTRSGAGS
jgi:ribosome recycling factor